MSLKKITAGRFTFTAWKDRGTRLQAGRVLYHAATKYWCRVGAWIFSVEIAGKTQNAA